MNALEEAVLRTGLAQERARLAAHRDPSNANWHAWADLIDAHQSALSAYEQASR